jgi:CTP:molybdopterin cytidylyltransferase MocA
VPGHPALLEGSLFEALLALRGDEGARDVFKSANTHLVVCDDVAVPTDVDVIDDLAALSQQEQR